MQEKIELDLNNPIFVFYYDVSMMSRQKAQESLEHIKKGFDIYSNATMWIVACRDQGTRIECIYDGWGRTRDVELFDLMKEINNRVDILSESKDFEDFKLNIREWRLGELLKENGDNEE